MSATTESELAALEEEFRGKLVARMSELLPAVQEYQAYEARLQQFDNPTATATARTTRSRSTQSRSSGSGASNGTSQRSGTRQEQLVALVGEQPGITIPQAAETLGVAPNYLYKVRDKAESEGQLRKDGPSHFVMTEADRVAARAAEIEASGKKG